MDILCLYLIVGIVVLEMVRPVGQNVPWGGILRSVLLWPLVTVMALLYIWSERHRR